MSSAVELEIWRKAVQTALTARETMLINTTAQQGASLMQSCIVRHLIEASGFKAKDLLEESE